MMNSRGKGFQTKQEGGDANESSTRTNTATTTASTSTSRQWAGFRNPRIVRVSRSFGGKDRHSKVCTVRGLRDRRIRLSVPTAIQLYDLQDRLGLSQPSKVVDWLIDNTKSDIDKLPPLQFPPENFLNMGSISSSSTSQFPHFFNNVGSSSNNADPGSSSVGFDQLTAQNFFPIGNINQPSFPSLLNNNPILPYNNPFYHWESQLGQSNNGIIPIPMQTQDSNNGINNTSSTSSSHQLYFCPPSLPSYLAAQAPVLENHDPSRVNHFQFLNSGSSASILQPGSSLMPTLHFVRPEILRMQENSSNHPNKGGNTGT